MQRIADPDPSIPLHRMFRFRSLRAMLFQGGAQTRGEDLQRQQRCYFKQDKRTQFEAIINNQKNIAIIDIFDPIILKST